MPSPVEIETTWLYLFLFLTQNELQTGHLLHLLRQRLGQISPSYSLEPEAFEMCDTVNF